MDTVQQTETEYHDKVLIEKTVLLQEKTDNTKAMNEFREFLTKDPAFVGKPGFEGLIFELDTNDIPGCIATIRIVIASILHNLEATKREKEIFKQKIESFFSS